MPTYKHNDYYGYINKIQEQAIKNPQWFWSSSEDASQARQWLYNNGASAIVDDIYNNTPDEMKTKIPAQYLSKGVRENRAIKSQMEKTNKIGKDFAKAGVGVAMTPALLSGFVAAPLATSFGLLGTNAGNKIGSFVGKTLGEDIYSKSVADNGVGSIISTNKQAGQELGGAIGSVLGGGFGFKAGSILANYGGFKNDLWTTEMGLDASDKYSKGLDAYQRWMSVKDKYIPELVNGEATHTGEIGVPYREMIAHLDAHFNNGKVLKDNEVLPISAGKHARHLMKFIDSAESALDFYKKLNTDGWYDVEPGDPRILITDEWAPWESRNYRNTHVSEVGLKSGWVDGDYANNYEVDFPMRGVITHELFHNNPIYNTRRSDIDPTITIKESPHYGNDYSRIPGWAKVLLKPKEGVNKHDSELSESFSDLGALKQDMLYNGYGKNGKFTMWDLFRYKMWPGKDFPGDRMRFLQQHPGWFRQLNALNEITGNEVEPFNPYKK